MNPEYMCIEEAPEPLPFHSQFETDFWESVSQDNSMHFSSQCSNFNGECLEMTSVYKDGKMEPFTEAVTKNFILQFRSVMKIIELV